MPTQLHDHLILSTQQKQHVQEETHRDATAEFRYMLDVFEKMRLAAHSTEDKEPYERMWNNAPSNLSCEAVRPPTGSGEVISLPSTRVLCSRRNYHTVISFPLSSQGRAMLGDTTFRSRYFGLHPERQIQCFTMRDIAEYN